MTCTRSERFGIQPRSCQCPLSGRAASRLLSQRGPRDVRDFPWGSRVTGTRDWEGSAFAGNSAGSAGKSCMVLPRQDASRRSAPPVCAHTRTHPDTCARSRDTRAHGRVHTRTRAHMGARVHARRGRSRARGGGARAGACGRAPRSDAVWPFPAPVGRRRPESRERAASDERAPRSAPERRPPPRARLRALRRLAGFTRPQRAARARLRVGPPPPPGRDVRKPGR